MAEDPRRRADEIAALRLGIDLGMTLIDTAEMYADGGAEELVDEAIDGRREEVFLVTNPGVTPAQVALAWVLRQDGVCAIPQSSRPEHVRENRGDLDVGLTSRDFADLDRAFPPPCSKQPLALL